MATVAFGTAVMANGAAMACGRDWPLCNGGFAEGGGLAALQVTHRMLAYTLATIAVVLAALAMRGHGPRRRAARGRAPVTRTSRLSAPKRPR